jgi:hypothetical protein
MFIMVLAEGVVVMLLGCLGRFRCQARSLGRCVVVVWRPARGRLASYLEPCVLRACVFVLVFVEVCVWCPFLYWGICPPFLLLNTAIRSSPACSRKRFPENYVLLQNS